jgi:aspartyl-tRNA(Asn)/glutamyl-tRNA(Gln) amidotransferase subunit C
MSLSLEDLDHVASLAHLTLTDDERHRYLGQLQSILDNMGVLNQLALDDTLELAKTDTPERSDTILPHQNIRLEGNAPQWESGYFVVPKMLD